jgi:hypothetical protein
MYTNLKLKIHVKIQVFPAYVAKVENSKDKQLTNRSTCRPTNKIMKSQYKDETDGLHHVRQEFMKNPTRILDVLRFNQVLPGRLWDHYFEISHDHFLDPILSSSCYVT